jgi:hypothetical protein
VPAAQVADRTIRYRVGEGAARYVMLTLQITLHDNVTET